MGRGGSDIDFSDAQRTGLDILDEIQPEPPMSLIERLAARVPEGGYMATVGPKGGDILDALSALEERPLDEFRTLPANVLYRIYETAEDANWHKVAGLAHKAWMEKQ